MSPGKLAAQCVHAALGLGADKYNMSVVVLQASDKKFWEIVNSTGNIFVVHDAGRTEVAPGTATCAAFYEEY